MRHQPLIMALSAPVTLWLAALATAQQTPAKPSTKPPAAPVPATAPAPSAKADPILEQLVEAHNKERAKEKLPPLKLEAKLTEAAQEHAKDMAEHSKMAHEGSDGSTPEQRVVNAGYRYLRTAENVAVGYKDVAEVLQGWMDSPGHRKNILGDYTEIGLAKVLGKDDQPYWCANFGKPMPKFEPANASKDLVKRLNEEREAAKLPPLAVDEKLAKAAQEQAVALAKRKSQGGKTANFDGIDQNKYADLAVSTASGHPDAEAMAKVLLAKDDLKAQVLGEYSKVGTGYATSEDGVPYWCLILANPTRPVETRPRKAKR